MSEEVNVPTIEGGQQASDVDEDSQSLPESMKKRIKAVRALETIAMSEEVNNVPTIEGGQQASNVDEDSQSLSESMKKRIKAVRALETKFDKDCKDLYEKRRKIISGEYEPTAEECEYPSKDEQPNENENQIKIEKANYPVDNENVKGVVSKFWLMVFKNSAILKLTVEDEDEPILSHLEDIKKRDESSSGFTLEFHFSENEYFTNRFLTKSYKIEKKEKSLPLQDYIFCFDEPVDIITKGCKIDWKDGKDIHLIIEKKQELETDDGIKTIIHTFENNRRSFFKFFNPPTKTELRNDEAVSSPRDEILRDFKLGIYFKDRIIPNATQYYTGENI